MTDSPPIQTEDMSGDTIDAFHFGSFFLVQPIGRGHRAGMDAMLLAAMVEQAGPIQVADLGAGAGAAGLAVAARLKQAVVTLVEMAPEMADYALKSLALAENGAVASRARVLVADVTLKGRERVAQGLPDDVYDHVIMNPPFNHADDRRAPDGLKAVAHVLHEGLFDAWIRTAGAILKPGGQMSLIARPESVGEIMMACGKRLGGLEFTMIHPRSGENAIRLLVSGVKGSRARPLFRAPLFMHGPGSHKFLPDVDDFNNGRAAYGRAKPAASRIGADD